MFNFYSSVGFINYLPRKIRKLLRNSQITLETDTIGNTIIENTPPSGIDGGARAAAAAA